MAEFKAGFARYVGCYESVNLISQHINGSGDLKNNGLVWFGWVGLDLMAYQPL